MKKDASKDFKNAVDKAFTTQPNVKLNSSTMKDAMALKQQFKEQDELEGGVGDEMTLKKLSKKHGVSLWEIVSQFDMGVEVEREHTNDLKKAMEIAIDHLTEDPKYYQKLNSIEKKQEPKVSAKKQFSKDLQTDKDFIDFKKRAKYKQGFKDFNFGTPNVTVDDPFISKRKWSRPGKEETFENIDKELKGNDKEMVNGIIEILNQIEDKENRMKVAKNMIQKFKKEGIKFDYNDFFQKSDLNKKGETKEATGSGSSGAFAGPIAFKDSEFLRNSFKETPKLKEGLATHDGSSWS